MKLNRSASWAKSDQNSLTRSGRRLGKNYQLSINLSVSKNTSDQTWFNVPLETGHITMGDFTFWLNFRSVRILDWAKDWVKPIGDIMRRQSHNCTCIKYNRIKLPRYMRHIITLCLLNSRVVLIPPPKWGYVISGVCLSVYLSVDRITRWALNRFSWNLVGLWIIYSCGEKY